MQLEKDDAELDLNLAQLLHREGGGWVPQEDFESDRGFLGEQTFGTMAVWCMNWKLKIVKLTPTF